ncbi:cyclic AMP-responsive element-binding protein 5-like isoform X1 [Hypomesus transpacificus]|uniref:cyclic AMP-responsive element-binding protein 5-like isoform X1 n=2 Tax=Hypomesus transpacificus TaxID=137520 RepID=UPI001F0782BC|nr:cyclic AMP-responsive element-binding protein 5-like isoform X1 [Hypomesus transpacificus]
MRLVKEMNKDQDRPYVCSAPACSQSFQTEAHLMIHRHKHEMTLKFPSIKTDNAFTDQTPTPTRFLRNCEEVGLFREIEEEFREEQEEEHNKQNLPKNGPSCPNQAQSRHQPQIQAQHHHPQTQTQHHHPQTHSSMMGPSCSLAAQQTLPSSQAGSVITQAPSTLTHSGPVPGSLSSLLHLRNRQRQPLAASMPGTLPDPAMQGASAQHMTMEGQMSRMMGIPGPSHNTSCSSPQRSKPTMGHHHPHHHPAVANSNNMTQMGHMMEMMSQRQHHHQQHLQAPPLPYQQHCHAPLQHMGNAHNHQGHQPGNAIHPQAHQSPPSHMQAGHTHQGSPHMPLLSIPGQLSPAAMSHSQHAVLSSGSSSSSGGGGGSGGRRRRSMDQDPDERRQKFLERNRAAATRCRQKRKVWVSSLEKKAEELTHTNMQLQNEVTTLRSEVGQLKQILLTHKDCPVTARQREAQGYPNPGRSPGGSPAPLCPASRQQAIQHNSVSTSSAAGGNAARRSHTDTKPAH